MQHAHVPVTVTTIAAGKLRRYHGETLLQRLSDVRTIVFNLRDIGYIAVGFLQSIWHLLQKRPDVVFAKGGYVCLPIGIAARLLGVPVVIHDSDTRPGLTNRILARFAHSIGTGSPVENYNYDPAKTHYVGVPIKDVFRPLTREKVRRARDAIGIIDVTAPLVVVTGGGLGAKSINEAMIQCGEAVIAAGIHVYHVTGKAHYESVAKRVPEHPHYHVVPFVFQNMHEVLGAADVVVSRASATFLQELAGLAKPAIVIPASHLGDQVKNAEVFKAAGAAIVLTDQMIAGGNTLGNAIMAVAGNPKRQQQLSQNLHQFAKPHAAAEVAAMIKKAYRD